MCIRDSRCCRPRCDAAALPQTGPRAECRSLVSLPLLGGASASHATQYLHRRYGKVSRGDMSCARELSWRFYVPAQPPPNPAIRPSGTPSTQDPLEGSRAPLPMTQARVQFCCLAATPRARWATLGPLTLALMSG